MIPLFLAATAYCVKASSPVGVCRRPFPAIMPLDYAYCRAMAWLDALNQAYRQLPPSLGYRLGEMGLDPRLGLLAAASFLYRPEAVTPDLSSSPEIKIFLEASENPEPFLEEKLEDLNKFYERMLLVAETEKLTGRMTDLWPDSLAGADQSLLELEDMASALAGLWADVKGDNGSSAQGMTKVESGAWRGSAICALKAIRAKLELHEPQDALEMTNNLISGLTTAKDCPDMPRDLQTWTLAHAHLARALAHWRLDQLGLAEVDMDEAIRGAQSLRHKRIMLGELLAARGELKRARRNFAGMCKDLRQACAENFCRPLMAVRNAGLCAGQDN